MSTLLSLLYRFVFKPLAFRFDPEFVHDRVTELGVLLGTTKVTRELVSAMLCYESPALEQTLLGIHFKNPIGLAAGFDKNAQLTQILPAVGFGFAELGSITGEYCPGNPGKRLWRLPKSESLLVYYGLKNDGAEAIANRLQAKHFSIPIGTSVAKTNNRDTVSLSGGIADYAKAYRLLAGIGDYTTVNISCPNAFGGQPFTDPSMLDALLAELETIPTKKPIFVKLSPDLGWTLVDEIMEVIDRHRVAGIVCANLTKDHSSSKVVEHGVPEVGGFSGRVVSDLSNQLIYQVYKKTKGKYIIIGCGGVFTAEDAYRKIRFGASLVQMITGMVYRGPQVVGEINEGLVKLLTRDGFKNISEAVGVDSKH